MLKIIRTIWSTIRTIVSIILIGVIVIVLTQRVSNNKMSIAGLRIFNVITRSMVPQYNVGDVLLTRWIDPSEIQVGDDITYQGTEESFKDKIVTHRVIMTKKTEEGFYIFQTQGIANDEPDPIINESQVYGKVLYKIKSITYLNGIIGNLYGMYFAIFIPMGLLFFVEFIINKKLDEAEENEEDYEDEKEEKESRRNRRRERRKKRRNKRKMARE